MAERTRLIMQPRTPYRKNQGGGGRTRGGTGQGRGERGIVGDIVNTFIPVARQKGLTILPISFKKKLSSLKDLITEF